MSDAAIPGAEIPSGLALLPRDLTPEELDAAPVLWSLDQLVIEDLTEAEDDAFAAALAS